MSGETERDVSGWTVDTLRSYIERVIAEHDRRFMGLLEERDTRYQQRFDAQQQGVRDALRSAQEAVTKAESAAERRFELQNEFRAQLGDQARTFLPRLEYDRAHIDLVERVQALDKRVGGNEGRGQGLNDAWGYLVAAIGLVGGVIAIVIAVQ